MSHVRCRPDGVEILPVGVQSWFAALFIVLWNAMVWKLMFLDALLEHREVNPIGLAIFGGVGLWFLWAGLLQGYLHERVILESGRLVLIREWLFIKFKREVSLVGIHDLTWNKSQGRKISFKDEGGKKYRFGSLLGLDEAKKVCLHLETLLPGGAPLSEKAAAKRKKLEEEDRQFREEIRQIAKAENVSDEELEKEEKEEEESEEREPLLGGLTAIGWGRLGLLLGCVFMPLCHLLKTPAIQKVVMHAAMYVLFAGALLFCVNLVLGLVNRTKRKKENKPDETPFWRKSMVVLVFFAGGLFFGMILGGILVTLLFGYQ